MNVDVRFNVEGFKWGNVRISGPDNICKPLLKYLLIRLVDNSQPFGVHFDEEGSET